MFCKFCGEELAEVGEFCPNCGKRQDETEVVVQETAPVEKTAPAPEPAPAPKPKKKTDKNKFSNDILIFGIIGLAATYNFGMPVLGLIFSLITKSKVGKFTLEYGDNDARVNVGSILSIVGIAVSIMTIVISIYILSLFFSYYALFLLALIMSF